MKAVAGALQSRDSGNAIVSPLDKLAAMVLCRMATTSAVFFWKTISSFAKCPQMVSLA
jgi:hypothetical protein